MSPVKSLSRKAAAVVFLAAACAAWADPLSKKTDIDFYRDVLSRDLHGLATRSDVRWRVPDSSVGRRGSGTSCTAARRIRVHA